MGQWFQRQNVSLSLAVLLSVSVCWVPVSAQSKSNQYSPYSDASAENVAEANALKARLAGYAQRQPVAQSKTVLKLPNKRVAAPAKPLYGPRAVSNQLLIMPAKGGQEDLQDSLREYGGDVIETIGSGSMTVWVVKFDSQNEFLQAERKLVNDKNVRSMQRNILYKTNAVSMNDQYFPNQWYLTALNVVPAWNISRGSKNIIGIIDSGVNRSIKDLLGKTYKGIDTVEDKNSQVDVEGHGTMVATTAAANGNNFVGTVGPALSSVVFPVRVGFPSGEVSVEAIIKGIEQCGNRNIKLINLSSNADPPYTFSHQRFNPVVHEWLKWYHDEKGGLVFNSAGNAAHQDVSVIKPYLIVVSALDQNYNLADFSTFGDCLWFTAPGDNITCTNREEQVVSVAGTSFSSPLACSIAALIWGAKPRLTNLDVEKILVATCTTAGDKRWTRWFGFGLPNAEEAMKLTMNSTVQSQLDNAEFHGKANALNKGAKKKGKGYRTAHAR